MPPVLHVSLNELMSGVKEYLRANHLRLDRQKGEGVLQLVAESKRATALIER
jgi:hypothetical protein